MASSAIPAPGSIAPLLPEGKLELKYLFGALLSSGAEYWQTEDDESKVSPGKNAIYDLLEHDDSGNCLLVDGQVVGKREVVVFVLQSDDVRYIVDTRDGHFEVQHYTGKGWLGSYFYVKTPTPGAERRFFYFRRRRHHKHVTGILQDDGSIKDGEETHSQECEYHFGWNEDGVRSEMVLV